MSKLVLGAMLCGAMVMSGQAQETETCLDFSMKKLGGDATSLQEYKGKVLLIVNVASKCGLTPQYEQLQELHEQFTDQGLAVLGFPCNQFGGQEPGSAEVIREFCSSKYNVTFDMFDKIEVNGDGACDLYQHLTSLDLKPTGKGEISWNFEKFLVSRDGKVVARFSPRTAPDDEELVAAIKKELSSGS